MAQHRVARASTPGTDTTATTTTAAVENVTRRFRDAVERRDLDDLMDCFGDDVVFHSPVSHHPFVGDGAVRAVLGAVMAEFEDFTYVAETHGTERSALWFTARVGGRDIEGVDVLHHPADARTAASLTVMIRPRSGLDAVAERIGARLLAAPRTDERPADTGSSGSDVR